MNGSFRKYLVYTIFELAFISAFLLQCTTEKVKKLATAETNCIISDKSRLESISIFPADNPMNENISGSETDPNSDSIIALIGSASIKPDFGSGLWDGSPIGIPFILVCDSQAKFPVIFRANDYDGNYGNESDPGPYPVPLSAAIEGNGSGDSHVLAVDIDNKILYELYNARAKTNSWEASCGASWDLKTNKRRPEGWTSADAAGLPILPLLVRYDEAASGTIDHAIRFTLSKSKVTHAYTYPASHLVNGTNDNQSAATPMGLRLRLKAGYDISSFSETNRAILNAMKNYGLILADIGSDLYISGAPDERWNNDDLNELKKIKASDFEVVKTGAIIIN